jgi:hypothetical protein
LLKSKRAPEQACSDELTRYGSRHGDFAPDAMFD